MERLGLKVLLDSGAFTVWKSLQHGKKVEPIRIEDYAAFVMEHQDVLYGFINLDVVGDPAESKENAEYLKRLGLRPIEVWHVGSGLKELQALVHEEQPVIALGGSVGISEKRRNRVFRWIFRLFKDQNFHFLGGSSKLLQSYPWFSADSTGWLVGRRFGAMIDQDGQRRGPTDMDPIEIMAYNIRYFASLEQAA
ncbi:hypothetical protein RB620_24660 [Paenibacillus sp. LHD-117]|uniref:hypothetical protein n=1 Tax=Paenibacillus sp. LHD-117 TaxID=3071412 RepID=UPI0027E0FC2D|nr:hypothetical protein [Paenibacillus sp. LHD-117]MDQ6422629.1 hypothetical protein [Paenibacillus sp. LHD-117]